MECLLRFQFVRWRFSVTIARQCFVIVRATQRRRVRARLLSSRGLSDAHDYVRFQLNNGDGLARCRFGPVANDPMRM